MWRVSGAVLWVSSTIRREDFHATSAASVTDRTER